ncbi:MAG TPA: nucleotidyltransferase domain-containing protein [bacterium]|jgi:predicted nucleotidyltransferase
MLATSKPDEKRYLDLIMGSGSRVDVLWCLIRAVDWGESLEISDIANRTGRAYKDVQRILEKLSNPIDSPGLNNRDDYLINASQVITRTIGVESPYSREKINGQVLRDIELMKKQGAVKYSINTYHPMYKPIRMLLEVGVGFLSVINAEVNDWMGVDIAFIYGSYAVADQSDESDIDLALIGYREKLEFYKPVHNLEERIGKSVHFIHYTPAQWQAESKKSDSFVKSLLYKPKVFLVGTDEDLARISR